MKNLSKMTELERVKAEKNLLAEKCAKLASFPFLRFSDPLSPQERKDINKYSAFVSKEQDRIFGKAYRKLAKQLKKRDELAREE